MSTIEHLNTPISVNNIDNTDDNRLPQIFLLIENPKKSNNLGPVIRCATAFGISTIIAIGYAQCSTNGMLSDIEFLYNRLLPDFDVTGKIAVDFIAVHVFITAFECFSFQYCILNRVILLLYK